MSNNLSTFLELVKGTAKGVVDNSEPSVLVFGTVETITPLTIRIDAQTVLQEKELILTHLVRDYEVDIEVSHRTVNDDILNTLHDHPGIPQNSFDSHHYHAYMGRKKIKIYQGLLIGEGVVMIKEQGGQRHIVLDRLDDPITSGEWF